MYDSPSAQEREVVAARHKSNINLFVIIHNPFYFVYFNCAILVCAVKEIYFSLFAINLVHFGIMPLFRCIFVLYCKGSSFFYYRIPFYLKCFSVFEKDMASLGNDNLPCFIFYGTNPYFRSKQMILSM